MNWGILVAAGRSERLQHSTQGVAKQFMIWQNEPLYMAAAKRFVESSAIHGLVFVFPQQNLEKERARVQAFEALSGIPCLCVAGGEQRQDSVRNGLSVLPETCHHVLVHDAARPFVSSTMIARMADMITACSLSKDTNIHGIVPALAVTDTIKRVKSTANGGRLIADTPNRSELVAVQTPQAFVTTTLRQAHDKARTNGWEVTDDAALLERLGVDVLVVEGEHKNIKITNPADLQRLQHAATPKFFEASNRTARPCVGYGYDVHRFISAEEDGARPLCLGGIFVPCELGIRAHSDGDVLLHALMDALLGCAAANDIGSIFPDSDPAYAGISSVVLLDEVLKHIRADGVHIEHVDITLVAQYPKIEPYRQAIRCNVARLLSLEQTQVNLKATTEEGLGFTGRKQGIKAIALVTGWCKKGRGEIIKRNELF